MSRALRQIHAGEIYHVMNRGVGRRVLFHSDEDYSHFVGLLQRARAREPVDLVALCLMPTHFHLVARPQRSDALSAYLHWLTGTHAQHYHRVRATTGLGHVYQDRFRCVWVRDERQLLTLIRYVEANPVRAGLVTRAEDWRWSSLRGHVGSTAADGRLAALVTQCPIRLPATWLALVNESARRSEPDADDTTSRTRLDAGGV